MEIKPSGRLGNLLQTMLIEFRFYNLPGGIFYKRGAAILAPDWNERTLRSADTNRENFYAGIRCRFGRFHRVSTELFAIGENDQATVSGRALAECIHCEIDRFRNVRSAFRNNFCVEIVDRFNRCFVVDGQRRLQKGATGERDQSNTVALKLIDQILSSELYALEPIGLDVVRKHAAGAILAKRIREALPRRGARRAEKVRPEPGSRITPKTILGTQSS